jgi:hypothetical protein
MTSAGLSVGIYVHSGIPVIALVGEWDEAAERLLAETVRRLERAGHLQIIVDLKQVTRIPLPERGRLDILESLAQSIRAHCGRLDVVGTAEQIESCVRERTRSLLRWAVSEEEAICRLKGVPRAVSGLKVSARCPRGERAEAVCESREKQPRVGKHPWFPKRAGFARYPGDTAS